MLLRKFGIEIIGAVPWGTHLCQFYECKQDLLDILVPYFTAGLRSNEFCLWITSSPLTVEEAKNALKLAVPELDTYIRKGQVEFLPYTTWYISRGKIDAEKISRALIEKEQVALNRGFEGLRTTGNVPAVEKLLWTLLWKKFTEYEKFVHGTIASHRIIALCTYPLEKCSASNILDIARFHSGTLIKRGTDWFFIEDVWQRRKSEKQYQNIIQTSIDAFWIVDSSGRFLDVNRAYCDIIGYSRNELLRMSLQDVTYATSEEIQTHMKKISQNTHDRFEARHRCKDGQAVDLEISANYMEKAGGENFFVFCP
jgi:PAS domain S-box-containing protein